jgi:hypothetical protein
MFSNHGLHECQPLTSRRLLLHWVRYCRALYFVLHFVKYELIERAILKIFCEASAAACRGMQ